jgi:hypothetical protein
MDILNVISNRVWQKSREVVHGKKKLNAWENSISL